MSSSHYDSAAYFADEDADKVVACFWPEDHARKLAFACGAYPSREAPGQRWVYHTSDTYLLGTALNQLPRQKTGDPKQDIFRDVLVQEIFAPLKLSPTAGHSRRSRDAAAQPFFDWDLTLHADDSLEIQRLIKPTLASSEHIHSPMNRDARMFTAKSCRVVTPIYKITAIIQPWPAPQTAVKPH